MNEKFLSGFEARLKETTAETVTGGRIAPPSLDDLRGMLQLQQTEFSNQLYQPAAPTGQELELLLEQAAFRGKFIPAKLTGETGKEGQPGLLNELSVDCLVDPLDQRFWILKPDVRSRILENLNRMGLLRDKARAASPDPEDRFAALLRKLILDPWRLWPDTMGRAELQLLLEILESVANVAIEKPELDEVKARLRSAALLDNYRHLIDRFVGRTKQLKDLGLFFRKRNYRMSRCLVTGSGGAGKSTIITRFAKDLLDQREALVVMLDFDRPGMSAADESWLTGEVSRQVGMQLQGQSRRLGMTRDSNTLEKGGFNFFQHGSLEREESARIDRYQLYDLQDVIAQAYLPLVLILDTVEEVVEQGGFNKLLRWLEQMETIAQAGSIAIFSGRVPDKYKLFANGIEEIKVPEFDQRTARVFLEKHGLEKELSARIARSRKVPRRPLELKMLAQLLEREDLSFEEIESELDNNVKLNKGRELFVSLIYRRVLQRIKKENVRMIAYPGLILRFVNTDLVARVLQPVLDFGELSEKERAAIVDDLAGYAWLAYRDDRGNVWHQQELRRTMLTLMHRKDPELAARIHAVAITYFESQAAPEAKAEALYHRLMQVDSLKDAESININELKKAAPYIGASTADLPVYAAVLLKYAQTGKVAVAELNFFPDRYVSRIYDRMGRQMVNKFLYEEAFQWYGRALRLKLNAPVESRLSYGPWEQDMLFNLAEFREIPRLQLYQQAPYGSPDAFLNYVWPAALIAPRDVSRQVMDQKVIADSFSKSAGVQDVQLTSLTQFTYACIAIGKREFNRATFNAYVLEWHRRYRYTNRSHYARNLLFLLLLLDKRPDTELALPPSHFRLNEEWFSWLVQLTGSGDYGAPARSLAIIRQARVAPVTIRAFLEEIDKDYTRSSTGTELMVKVRDMSLERLGELARGSDAMFRQPCKAAIKAALADGLSCETLRIAFVSSVQLQVAELQPDEFEQLLDKDPNLLEPLIELVDRSWTLALFLNNLCQAWQGTEKLNQLQESYLRLDEAIRSLFVK